ncbi:MAG: hypothetical protein Q8Q63_11685 [Phaeovulum sp.]|uniref:hypothetical protein n=1 Tax=Phaeovulum sp. TaxID=2934796 RepID=UPI002732CB79|nr:hypothetical protein [Phaeovulum sp.]MDP3862232.1 hypothetical protein [Phaeovulum sp.]
MPLVTHLFRLSLVLAITLGLISGVWTAGPDRSRMAGLHDAAMQTIHHDMSAMAGPAVEVNVIGVGIAALCKQHCSAVAAVLPVAWTPPVVDAHRAPRERPQQAALGSTSPLPVRPPPKASFA